MSEGRDIRQASIRVRLAAAAFADVAEAVTDSER